MVATAALRESYHYDTIVIGAGISGLACASRLYQHPSYQKEGKLLVLEGRERIGGRINSVHVNGCRLDTGANWIHGIGTEAQRNPLIDILPHKCYKELQGMVAFRPPAKDSSRVSSDELREENGWVNVPSPNTSLRPAIDSGKPHIFPAKYAGQMYGALWEMVEQLHELAANTREKEAKNTTILQAIRQTGVIGDIVKQLPEECHTAFQSMPAFIETMEAGPLVSQSNETPNSSSALGLLEFAIGDFEGEQVFLQDGYLAIIDEIAKDLIKEGLIRTNSEVQTIDWGRGPIMIKTSHTTYTANKVICRIPLGVLQHSTSDGLGLEQSNSTSLGSETNRSATSALFQPPLPKETLLAIRSLGFGTFDKIFVTYKTPWWEQEPFSTVLQPGIVTRPFIPEHPPTSSDTSQRIPDSLLGFTYELPGFQILPDGTATDGPRLFSFINLHNITGQRALCAFVSGGNATTIETWSDEAAGDLVHRTLQSWFRRDDIPPPEAVHVTRWAEDSFSRGSYSHMIAGRSLKSHRECFASPLESEDGSQLRFAGEHTSAEHFATAHGALLSGWREADTILGTFK